MVEILDEGGNTAAWVSFHELYAWFLKARPGDYFLRGSSGVVALTVTEVIS